MGDAPRESGGGLVLHVGDTRIALEVGQSLILGSAPDCDVRLNHAAVAPRHVLLRIREDRVLMDDLNSSSGTFVGGQKVEQFDLRAGDIAVLGHIPVHLSSQAPQHVAAQTAPQALPVEAVPEPKPRVRSLRNLPIRMRDEAAFRDLMAEELRRTPWLTLSVAIHAALLLLLYLIMQPDPPGYSKSIEIGTRGPEGILPDALFASGDEPIEVEEVALNSELQDEFEADDREAFEASEEPLFLWPVAGRTNNEDLLMTRVSPRSGSGEDVLNGGMGLNTGGFIESVNEIRESGLEIVFVFDSTGSMGSVIELTKTRIGRMLEVLQALVPDARVGLVTYRDHGQDEDYLVRSIPLGQDFYRAINFMQVISARGGGNRPEAVREGLKEAFDQKWRRGSRRVVILIGDAPPHANSMLTIGKELSAFMRGGTSFLHGIVTRPNGGRRLPSDTLAMFERISKQGKGRCLPFEDEEGLLLDVLSLAFGEEYRNNLEEVYRIVDSRNSKVSMAARSVVRSTSGDLLRRRLSSSPVPDNVVREIVRHPSENLAMHLVEILSRPRYPEPGRHAAAYALQQMLELRSPPLDPEEGGRLSVPEARQLAALVRDRF